MTKPYRPPLRYMGSKWRLAPRILPYFPPHLTYAELFGGGASLLLQKPRAACEIYNDLDGSVVSFFRVLRDRPAAAELIRLLEMTPFAREEFEASFESADDPIEAARRMVVRSFMAHGSTGLSPAKRRTGFRSDSFTPRKTQAKNWTELPGALVDVVARLQGVTIENRPALELLGPLNRPDVLLYLDPPYMPSTRTQRRVRGALEHAYRCEMSEADHAELLQRILAVDAMVVLSGYPSETYDQVLGDWRRVEMATRLSQGPRTEVVWLNPAAWRALDRPTLQRPLELEAA